MSEEATRTLVVHCPDWPVLAADPEPAAPVAVVRANRVVAASMAARQAGVAPGLRRRESQRRCPTLQVVDHDPGRDARAFEPVASSLDAVTPGIEVTRPGTLAFATRGPSRYFGGDDALAERVGWMVSGALGGRWPVHVGVAGSAFAALLAARRCGHRGAGQVVVPSGPATAAFLAPHPVGVLLEAIEVPELVDVWQRLGLRTLGLLADLPRGDVAARFGHPGVAAHRLASGEDLRPPAARRPAPDLAVSVELDPPVDRVDRAAFAAKALADQLHARLEGDGLACTQVLVEARTAHGEVLGRCWRHEGALSSGALADRVRWQLDGWLGRGPGRPTAGLVHLGLVPVEVVAARGRQLGFWGGETLVDERVWRAVARLQAMLGAEAVTVPEVRGGRSPAERVIRVPVAAVDLSEARPAARLAAVTEPWPGQLPAPSPATVLAEAEAVALVDAAGEPVAVSGRSELSAPPARLRRAGRAAVEVAAWAGPWPVDERWWDPDRHRRRARLQLVDHHGAAHLVAVEAGTWWLEATYD